MKKTITGCLLITLFGFRANADHITGGEMYYSFAGMVNGQYQYSVTLKFYMRCNSGRQFNNPTIVSIFDKSSFGRVMDLNVALSSSQTISITDNHPCVTNPPQVCYEVGFYHFIVTLPPSSMGYVLASHVNYRIAGIHNLALGYGLIGATYTAEIPGTSALANAAENNSAHFTGTDLVIVCADNSFSYSFAAEDGDGDELRYSFCNAYQSTGGGGPGGGSPPASPPYPSVPYGSPTFSGDAPLGNKVQINSTTGLITGIAPTEGPYVVTVCVEEIRAGKVIATQRKDLQINIAPCSIAAASIPPVYMLCGNTQTIDLVNYSTSPLITSQYWELSGPNGNILFASLSATASYTFPDTGLYKVKLVVNRGQECSDSALSVARVYPGFAPSFRAEGICFNKPTHFFDMSQSVFGVVNSWNWDFGEALSADDFSNGENPVYTYQAMGSKFVSLIVTDTKGCADTLVKVINIVDKPPLSLGFRDTLICLPDAIQLQAIGSGIFSWTPSANMINANSPAPIVAPHFTTTFYVELNDQGCLNRDSVKINVTDHVSLQAMNDTVVCQGDTITLRIVSDGLKYSWEPASQIFNSTVTNPTVITHTLTNYEVTATIGSCQAREIIVVHTVPYPLANAGGDTLICFNTTAYLHGKTDGNSVKWLPPSSLNNSNILNPVASPVGTTRYTLLAYDSEGCPKPGVDEIVVTVLNPIIPFAGNDTSVVIDQPLQLQATGGVRYEWSPALGLSATEISNPVARYFQPADEILYKVLVFNEAGCFAQDEIKVKVFAGKPVVFVPTAFTPNGDGLNDIIKPIAAGMKQMEYFRIYNRWGQLVFDTRTVGSGWDGTIGGKQQGPDTYVWVVKAVDYSGNPYLKRGTVTLIR